jgi:hypothetical protein
VPVARAFVARAPVARVAAGLVAAAVGVPRRRPSNDPGLRGASEVALVRDTVLALAVEPVELEEPEAAVASETVEPRPRRRLSLGLAAGTGGAEAATLRACSAWRC